VVFWGGALGLALIGEEEGERASRPCQDWHRPPPLSSPNTSKQRDVTRVMQLDQRGINVLELPF
jgi:hypothetical protein